MSSLAYRPATSDDMPLVVDTWVDSYRLSRAAGMISMEDWADIMTGQVRKVLMRPGVKLWVAYHPGDTDHREDLYGWLAVETEYEIPRNMLRSGRRSREMGKADVPLVHYVYVKQPYRRMKIARGLFKAAGVGDEFNHTCTTAVVSTLTKKNKLPGARWTHLVARFPKH